MKKICFISLLSLCPMECSLAQEVSSVDNTPNLTGFYLGGGAHVNFDEGKVKNREDITLFWLDRAKYVPSNSTLSKQKDTNAGIHLVFGYGHLFPNRCFTAIEQQIGYAHHSNKVDIKAIETKVENQICKPWEFTTLMRLGYGFKTVPGIIYLSGGIKVLKIDLDDSKTIVRPTFGLGYQHGLSKHWSLRGDVMYTHVGNVNYVEKKRDFVLTDIKLKGNGHRLSCAITFVYTF